MATDYSKFHVEEISEGSGPEVAGGDYISIHYTGTLTNGEVFDSSHKRGEPFQTRIGVGQVIEGWDMGVVGMKAGGKRRLIIPPQLAYGDRAVGSIPANSTLIFEVELVSID
jgi:FKBP-type peptidyl-prolyl cis-trans isomerase